MTDQQIIQLIQQDKTSRAFTRLYRYFPAVCKLVTARGGSKNDALDIYQDALVILCRKVQESNFTLTASLDTYLYSVCRFLWNDELKKRNRSGESDWEKVNDVVDEQEWKQVNEEENHLKLAEKVLQEIGKKCLQLLQLFYTEGKSMKQIANKMEFNSEKIAKNQKYKCLERAKMKLKEMQEKTNHL